MVFNPGYKIITAPPERSYIFLYKSDELLLRHEEGGYSVPLMSSDEIGQLNMDLTQYIGEIDKTPCIAGGILEGFQPSHAGTDLLFLRVYDLFGKTGDAFFKAAGLGNHLVHWMKNNKYCGKCGMVMSDSARERARHCENCGNTVYPRISPAVIVAVIREGKLLMARAARFRSKFYSVIAGFIEPGESAEECVKREVQEETNIRIKDIKYFGSQPWPFPDSLMLAYTALYESGEIMIDGREILDAAWFSPAEIQYGPISTSVARKLIDWFIRDFSRV